MPSSTDDPINKEEVLVVDIEQPAEVCHETVSAKTFLLKCFRYIESLPRRLGRLSKDCYRQIFGVIMLPSPLKFVFFGLAGFAEMKAQGYDFPFKTHPRSMNVAITTLLFYGLASAVEHVICTTRLGPTSAYAIAAHSGRIGCFCILVVTLASLFYL